MKKVAVLIALFLVVLVASAGMTMLTAEKASAAGTNIATYIYCSQQTGANCTNPLYPYYLFVVDRYGQHFVGCCNGLTD